jgi:GDPmannose 4,6-dehydratase
MTRHALITGITGQDGGFLAARLLARGDRVTGTTRGDPAAARAALPADAAGAQVIAIDPSDGAAIRDAIDRHAPDVVYHLAAPADPNVAWRTPSAAVDAIATGTARWLETILERRPATRFVLAGSCQVFGPESEAPQSERTPYAPRHPYGAAKALAALLVTSFREGRGLHASTALLYNHESARRPANYVTARICDAAVRIAEEGPGAAQLELGTLTVVRDWGHAADHMGALVAMADADVADDYVIGTGVGRTVADFCAAAFGAVGLDWERHVVSSAALARPGDVPALVADPSRAARALGWRATTPFEALLAEMLDAARARRATAPR